MIINSRFFNRSELIGFVALALLLFVILPLTLDVFRLNLVAKYLTYAFVAIGLVLCWGYGGILSLGQGVFFGLGGYCMAMYLKLEASSVANTKIQSTPGIPDFMDWNQITQLPFFWKPFHSFPFTLLAIILVPAFFSFIIGAAMFKRRVGGVYFAIITQAIAAILTILIVGQQGYTGGINGITDLRTLHGWDIRTDHAKFILYFVEVLLLFGCVVAAQFIRLTKLGRILVAMHDLMEKEEIDTPAELAERLDTSVETIKNAKKRIKRAWRRVIDAIGHYLSHDNANSGGNYETSRRTDRMLQEARHAHQVGTGLPAQREDAFAEVFDASAVALADDRRRQPRALRPPQAGGVGAARDDLDDPGIEPSRGDALDQVLQRRPAAAYQNGEADGCRH